MTQDIVIKNQMSIGFHQKPTYGFKRIRWINKLIQISEVKQFDLLLHFALRNEQLSEAALIWLDEHGAQLKVLRYYLGS